MKKSIALSILLACSSCEQPQPVASSSSPDAFTDVYREEMNKLRFELEQCRAHTPIVNFTFPLLQLDKDGATVTNSVFIGSKLTDEQMAEVRRRVGEVLKKDFTLPTPEPTETPK